MIPQLISAIDKKCSFLRTPATAWKSIRVWKNYYLRKEAVLEYYERKFVTPRKLYMECTNVCNARCFFCAYPQLARTIKPRYMDLGAFERILAEFAAIGGDSISLTPTLGDPLLDKYFTRRLSIIDRSPIRSVHFYTNLINYNDDIEQALDKLDNTSLAFFVSVMGFNREAYKRYMGVDKFDIVQGNLERLAGLTKRKKNITLRVKVQDYRGAGRDRTEFFGFMDRLGISCNIGRRLDTWGGLIEDKVMAEDSVDVKIRQPRLGPCKVSYTKPVVTVDLKLKLCDCRDINDELAVGDLSERPLAEIWRGDAAREIRERMFDDSRMPSVCRKCELYTSIFDHKGFK